MLKDAEILPYNTFSLLDQTGSVKEGRGALYDRIPVRLSVLGWKCAIPFQVGGICLE